jgi:hypothetical protein
VPNRRRRRLSTATSAFAALAVASPFAYIAVCDLTAKPAPQHQEFVRAASMTDLPGELMGALTQGLSQFGVSLPPIPSLTGATSPDSAGLPGLGGLTSPGLTSPGLASPGLTSPGLTSPGLTSPGLTTPGLTSPGLTPGATPGLATPGLATPGLATPGLTPGLTSTTPGLSTPGLASPGLSTPGAFGPTTGAGGLSSPSELPISDPVGLDPSSGTYPILGDPSLGAAPAPSGGLVSDMMSAANQLGAGQAIDLLKGMILPGLTQAAHGAAAPIPPPPAPIP